MTDIVTAQNIDVFFWDILYLDLRIFVGNRIS
jgi:hypothetical protein